MLCIFFAPTTPPPPPLLSSTPSHYNSWSLSSCLTRYPSPPPSQYLECKVNARIDRWFLNMQGLEYNMGVETDISKRSHHTSYWFMYNLIKHYRRTHHCSGVSSCHYYRLTASIRPCVTKFLFGHSTLLF